jgi:phosphoglycolate phosphatase
MRFDAVIFDFDGTLVDSARAKYQAFFSLFPPSDEHRAVVASVLERDPDGSRYQVIPRMFQEMVGRGLSVPAHHSPGDRIEAYGELVLAAVKQAQEIRGASELLQALRGRCAVYISSNT